MSGTGSAAFRWFIAGDFNASGICAPTVRPAVTGIPSKAYNLQGQSVNPATYRGIIIRDGRKTLLR